MLSDFQYLYDVLKILQKFCLINLCYFKYKLIQCMYFLNFSCYSNLISETEAPVGIIGNTLSSFSTETSKK